MRRLVASFSALFVLACVLSYAASEVVVLETSEPVQGEIFHVSVLSFVPIDSAYVEYEGNRAYLRISGRRAEGYFGFDLASPPGEKNLSIFVERGGKTVKIVKKVLLKDAGFPVQRIEGVPDNYVNPGKKALERIFKEKRLLSSIWKSSSRRIFWRGNFVPPLKGFECKGFGTRRFINGQPRSPHTGVDCSAPEGTPVVAVNRGVVRLTRNLFFSGNSVIIDHGGGIFSMYFHLKEMYVSEGEMVEKGEVIGAVGSTGRVTGPHLHFGMRIVDQRVNPVSLIR